MAPASVDLLYGANVVHVARNLRRTLGEARRALVPGGWLVAGECLRPFPGQPTFAELVFRLFAGFTSVDIDPELRPTAGLLTPEQWTVALADACFDDIQIHPDLPRVREIFPQFAVGAMCARRPLTD